MKPEIIIQINPILNADILFLTEKVSQGASINQLIFNTSSNGKKNTPSPVEYQKTIDDQGSTFSELQEQVSTPLSTLQKFV